MKSCDPQLACLEDDIKVMGSEELELSPVGSEFDNIAFFILDFVEVFEPPFLVSE